MLTPQTLVWTAPTENTDGSPIDYVLNYTLGITPDGTGEPEEVASFPGTLSENGKYTAPLSDMGSWEAGQKVSLYLRAFAADNPPRKSPWSDPVAVEFNFGPKAPTAVGVIY